VQKVTVEQQTNQTKIFYCSGNDIVWGGGGELKLMMKM